MDQTLWLATAILTQRPSAKCAVGDLDVTPGLTIRRSGELWMAAIKTIHQIHRFLHRFPTPNSQVPHMNELTLQTPECFKPLDQPSRYKAAYGGRGSGKSWHLLPDQSRSQGCLHS